MNPSHLHLMLNHIPVVGMPFGLALVSLAFLRKSEELKRISLGFITIIALLAIPVYLTGEPAEELVENLPGTAAILSPLLFQWGRHRKQASKRGTPRAGDS